jgi:hypothetical protein
MKPHRHPRVHPPERAAALMWGAVVAGTLLAATFLGWGFAAPATIGSGTPEQAQGADVGEKTPTYWVWEGTQRWMIPTPVPALLSSVVTVPTVLPATAATYAINAATAANTSVRWTFQETVAAPTSTELELRFTAGLSRAAVTITVYLETRSTGLTGALLFTLFWDAGPFAPTGITVQTMQVTVQACASVGHCP